MQTMRGPQTAGRYGTAREIARGLLRFAVHDLYSGDDAIAADAANGGNDIVDVAIDFHG